MEFDKSKIFTSVNADEVKIGSKGYFADSLGQLKQKVRDDEEIEEIAEIEPEREKSRFIYKDYKNQCGIEFSFSLFYLVEEPKEKTYRPYRTCAEMISDFIERYNSYSGAINTHNPMYNPLIWLILKSDNSKRLVFGFLTNSENGLDYVNIASLTYVSLGAIFENYTYLDGSPCGKLEN